MNSSSVDLLRKLSSGVRPDGSSSALAAPTDAAGFEQLLQRVRAGEVNSGRALTVAPGVSTNLSQDQIERLGIVTDAAEAAGAENLLAFIDGVPVSIDVASRRIESAGQNLAGSVLTSFDAVVIVPQGGAHELRGLFANAAGRTGGAASAQTLGVERVRNSSVADLLASINQHRPHTDPAELDPEPQDARLQEN